MATREVGEVQVEPRVVNGKKEIRGISTELLFEPRHGFQDRTDRQKDREKSHHGSFDQVLAEFDARLRELGSAEADKLSVRPTKLQGLDQMSGMEISGCFSCGNEDSTR